MPRKHGPLVTSVRIFLIRTYVWQERPNNLIGLAVIALLIGKTFNAIFKMFMITSLSLVTELVGDIPNLCLARTLALITDYHSTGYNSTCQV